MYSQAFIRAKNFTLAEKIEGEFSLDPEDDGNWTGGKKGVGDLIGTKYGLSAAAYPAMDIPLVSFEQAVAVYHRDYWQAVKGDELPPRLAIAVFDAAVNQGPTTAIKLLQSAVGTVVDGAIGPATIAATRRMEQDEAIANFIAARQLRYTKGDKAKFDRYGNGWFRRCVYLAMECAR